MKIGLFTDTYSPQINGVATSVSILKRELEARGHLVYVFTTTDPNSVKDETNVYRLPSIPFNNTRRLSMPYNPHLVGLIKEMRLDLVHTHTEFSLGIFGKAMARNLDIPLVHTMHTIYEKYTHYITRLEMMDPIAKLAARKWSRHFCNWADEIIVPTEKVKKLLLSYGVRRDISVIPTGIELDKFSRSGYDPAIILKLRDDLGIRPHEKVLIYIGRISEEKNIEEIFWDTRSYLQNRDDVKVLLIGDGPSKSSLEKLAKGLGIYHKTVFTGARPQNEIPLYYQLGDIFVSASQSETQGLTYIEALASGLPVVAKEDLCLDGVIKNGINGYTFQDQEDFIQALDRILSDPRHKEQLSLGAVGSAKKFSASCFSDSVEDLYRNILNDSVLNLKIG